MEDWKVTKAIRELSVDGIIPKETQLELFKEMHEDLKKDIPPEECNARAILMLANQKMITAILKKIIGNHAHIDEDSDIYHAAKVAFIDAIDTFDYTRNISFSTYAYNHIHMKLLHFFQSENRKKKAIVISLSEMIKEYDKKKLDFDIADSYNLSEDVDNILDAENRRKLIFSKFRHLTEKEQNVIVLYFGLFGNKPTSCPKIAKKLDVSQSSINSKLLEGIRKLTLLLKEGSLSKEEQIKFDKIKKKKHSLIPCIQEFFDKVNSQTSSLENI